MYDLYDRVEALLEHGWSRGNVSEVLGDGRYRVYVKHLKKEVLLNSSALRPPTAQPGVLVESSKAGTLMEGPTYDLNEVADGEQPQIGDVAANTSAGREKNTENSQDIIKPPMKKKTTYRREGKKQREARIVFKEPDASPEAQGEDGDAVIAAKGGSLKAVERLDLRTAVSEQLDQPATSAAADTSASPERNLENSQDIIKPPAKKKATYRRKRKQQASIGATRLKSQRQKHAKFDSAIRVLQSKPRERKSASGTSPSTEGTQAKKKRAKANDPSRDGAAGESSAAASGEDFSRVSDDETSLSASIPEAGRNEDTAGNVDTPAPFAKTSPLWDAVDSLEIFRKMPQRPHFRPLSSSNEIVREGLAIAMMVNFSAVVEKISKFNLDEPASLLEDCLETLSDLETHGFVVEPIRRRVDRLLSIKTTYDEVQDLSKELIKGKEAMSLVEEGVEDINEQIRRLEGERSAAEEERVAREDDIRVLQAQFDEVREFVDSARDEFERVVNAPW